MLNLRLWKFAVTFQRYPASVGWEILKWRYYDKSSWAHGTAYLGRVKVVW